MRVFYDAEFVERGPQLPIQPISFGFVAENGQELYVINEESLTNLMRSAWLSVNVAPSLPIQLDQRMENSGFNGFITQWDPNHEEYQHVLSLDYLAQEVHKFLTSFENLELWAYYGHYDHVVLCQLFGSMVDLPPGIPMWSHELQQVIESDPHVILPPQPKVPHHALHDARWNFEAFNVLNGR